MIAAFAAAATSDAVFGIQPPLYELPSFTVHNFLEYPGYAALGVVCGALAVLFMTTIRLSALMFSRLPIPVPVRTMIGGALVGLIGVQIPEIYGNGYETTRAILTSSFAVQTLLLLCARQDRRDRVQRRQRDARRRVHADALHRRGDRRGLRAGPGRTSTSRPRPRRPGSYALLGMAAALAGMTHAPLLSTVLIVELTSNHGMILPLLLDHALRRGPCRASSRRSRSTPRSSSARASRPRARSNPASCGRSRCAT